METSGIPASKPGRIAGGFGAAAWWFRFRARLFRPEDAASLGALRVAFGLLMAWEVLRFFQHGWIWRYYIDPPFHFTYYGFEWVRPLPGAGMYVLFAVMGVLALMVAAGLFFRPAIIGFTLCFAYVFLCEQARYLNHFYLIILVGLLLSVTDGNRWMSLDRRFFGRPSVVPFWQIFLLRAQLFIVYFYAGVAKLNPDWLRGEPLRLWLEGRASYPFIGPLLAQEVSIWIIAYGGLLFDLGIGFLLVYRRTRTLGMVLALLFHATNNFLFRIGVFPFLALAYTLIFLDPDWPRRFLYDLGFGGKPKPPPHPPEGFPIRASVLGGLAVYLALQALIPLRHWLYPGDVNWTEEGHRFSWRMKLRDKESRIAFSVRDPDTDREAAVNLYRYARPWQIQAMMDRPDMVLQMAHRIAHVTRATSGVARPEVYARVRCSLNGAPEADLIDPQVNLAAVRRGLGRSTWILPRGKVPRTGPPPPRRPLDAGTE